MTEIRSESGLAEERPSRKWRRQRKRRLCTCSQPGPSAQGPPQTHSYARLPAAPRCPPPEKEKKNTDQEKEDEDIKAKENNIFMIAEGGGIGGGEEEEKEEDDANGEQEDENEDDDGRVGKKSSYNEKDDVHVSKIRELGRLRAACVLAAAAGRPGVGATSHSPSLRSGGALETTHSMPNASRAALPLRTTHTLATALCATHCCTPEVSSRHGTT
ncbi:uncharacterized protein LOC126298305 [Schistocerca gregaria]|uniref:uncharacterized protein LOC126298305 n=1 Tax=Schistocerca gregaria TaxID=7010 RepID=UPI00211F2204|nr:uncharacterized protein LOC126298305 [Schistocerca gregaria]